jgi:hypothetical protein
MFSKLLNRNQLHVIFRNVVKIFFHVSRVQCCSYTLFPIRGTYNAISDVKSLVLLQ